MFTFYDHDGGDYNKTGNVDVNGHSVYGVHSLRLSEHWCLMFKSVQGMKLCLSSLCIILLIATFPHIWRFGSAMD